MSRDQSTSPFPAMTFRAVQRRNLALLRPVWPLALLAGALGLAGGVTTVTLLAGITSALGAGGGMDRTTLMWLAGLAIAAPAMAFVSELCNAVVGQRIVARLRRELCERIAASPLDRVERLTQPRLMAVLTGDLDTLSGTALAVAPLLAAAATVVGGLGYLGWLAPDLFVFAALALTVGYGVTAWLRRVALSRLETARTTHEEMLHGFRAVVEGGKEIRLSQPRRDREIGERLTGAIGRIAALHIRMRTLFGLADSISASLLFAVALSVLALGRETASVGAFVVALLYLRGPLDQVVSALPMFARAQVALRRIAGLETELGEGEAITRAAAAPAFESIELSGVSFRYAGAEKAAVGPIDLTLRPGEIVFVTGSNGAGKSTLTKLLTGLYRPETGTVCLDGRVMAHGDAAYRGLFSTVFHDFHAFGELLLPADLDLGVLEGLVARLGLSGKVTVERNGSLRHAALSAGQRRRLALLQVYLDRSPVIVLDEWAAEQDPHFRRFFYEALLPELRDRGACVVLVTHDDRYFGCADRLLEITPAGVREECHRRAA